MSPRAPETAEKQHLIHTQQVGRHIKRRSPGQTQRPTSRRTKRKPSGAATKPRRPQKRRTHLSLNTAPRNGPAPQTQHRRKAVETLAEVLTNAMRRAAGEKAREAIQQRGYLDWHTRSPPAGVRAGAHTPYMTTAAGAEGGKTPRGADASPTPLPFALRW